MSSCLVALALLLGGAAAIQAQEAPKVLMAIKLPPPKSLSDDLMGLARKIVPGQQTEFLPMMVLGQFGYPSFPGVSETENVTVFIFEPQKGEAEPFVIMAKMDNDAMLKNALTAKAENTGSMFGMLTPGFVTTDRDGWTLFSDTEANFTYASDMDALEKIADQMSGFDINLRIFIGPENAAMWTEKIKNKLADEHLLEGGSESDPELLRMNQWTDFFASIAQNLEWFSGGIDIDPETVAVGWSVQAIEGTPEYELLSMKAGGEVPVAQYVPASTYSYAYRLDMDAVQKYYDVLEERGMLMATDEGREWITKLGEYNRKLFAKMDGTAAGVFPMFDESVVGNGVLGGDIDEDTFNEVMQFYCNEFFPYAIKTLAADSPMMNMEYRTDVAKIDDRSISELVSTYRNIQVELNEDEGSEESDVTTDNSFFLTINGDMLSAASLEVLEGLAKNVAEQTPVEDSIASRIQLKAGQSSAYRIDVRSLMNLFTSEFESESEVARQAYKSLASSDLEPVTGVTSLGDGRMTDKVSAPVSTLVKFAATYRQIQQAEGDMQNHSGGQPMTPPEDANE
ncbi:hypothetical protein [Cerasicoccus fimbriatus]|uniref:hypothetical protein n=1 Tax=Cerasicoccus fimbriatus TaxID=3014554 RepID=UPI0022B58D21|nr:hypothetical protein [Cerasicoccus sp. TK19100]